MKILAIEREEESITPDAFQSYLKLEAIRLWELYQAGIVRELYFRQDRSEAVLMLECADLAEAHRALTSLPLVEAGLIAFELIPLKPYPGFSRLFSANQKRPPSREEPGNVR